MLRFNKRGSGNVFDSRLYDHETFYPAFNTDLKNCTRELIIESPFITTKRMRQLLPIIRSLRGCGVRIIINTRTHDAHDPNYRLQAELAVAALQALDVVVLYT